MDQERERIQADLRGLLAGEVYCDDLHLQMYSSDASIYEICPLAVVRPKSTKDVASLTQYASENGISIHARGAGSGLAGGCLGAGIVVDFSHSMRRVLWTDTETVRVQPGVVLHQLNKQLNAQGRMFGPDRSTGRVTTMGSVIAVDAAGSHWLRYGSAAGRVESLQIVLADGEVLETGKHSVDLAASARDDDRLGQIVFQVSRLLQEEASTIEKSRAKSPLRRFAYNIDNVLENGTLDMAKLLAGSEGTLGLITEATVRTEALPAARGVALLMFERLDQAARAVMEVRRFQASACDLMDRRLLSLARESDVRYDLLLPKETEALLLVEQQGANTNEVREQLQQTIHQIQRRKRLAFDFRLATEPDEINQLWNLASHVVPSLYRLKGSTRAIPFVEDVAVPPAFLPEFFVTLQNILKKHQVTASLFAHAGHGQLRIRPFLDISNPQHQQMMPQLATDLYKAVSDVGGIVSSSHGNGLSRTWFLRQQAGPLYRVFRELKQIFDPRNLLNPGKVVTDFSTPLMRNVRSVTAKRSVSQQLVAPPELQAENKSNDRPQLVQLQLNWSSDEMVLTTRACNGCGSCRSHLDAERMCPIFRFTPGEEASPRAKANLLRGILTGQLDMATMASEELKEVADLCVHCHQCRLECPAEVDIPKLMVECKSQFAAVNGLRQVDWFLTHLDRVSKWAMRLRRFSHWSVKTRQMRWLMEKTLGISQERKLPLVSRRSFLRIAQRKKWTRPLRSGEQKVLYFVDVYANWYDVQLAEAFVAILEHNRVPVFVHPEQLPSGMPLIVAGSVDKAKKVAARNVSILADAVRHGYHIVTTEPSAALCLSHEYPQLLDDEDARLVAQNVTEACTYLWRRHQKGDLELDLKPVRYSVGYHTPCHIRALTNGIAGENLLRLIPGLNVVSIDKGCSGMAGTYGLKRENYRRSLRVGWGLISALRESTIQVGTTECSACKIQMEQGTTKPTVHPLKLLALSYGCMPEVAKLLSKPGEELTVT